MEVDSTFEEIYEADYQSVFRAAYLACGERGMAEDATQEAFARALERWDRLRNQDYVSGWIMTTALNAVKGIRRRLRRISPHPSPSLVSEQEVDLTQHETDLWTGIRALPARQRNAVLLHYFAGFGVAEIGTLLGCREGTVKSHLSRARESLRRHLQEEAHA